MYLIEYAIWALMDNILKYPYVDAYFKLSDENYLRQLVLDLIDGNIYLLWITLSRSLT